MPEILIVDDDRAAGEALRIRLTHAGHHAMVASCGRDAIQKFDALKPYLVFLDAALPDVSGFDVGQYIRQCDPGHSVEIVFVSGVCVPSSDYIHRCAAFSGGDHFVSKPYDSRDILEIVEHAWEHLESITP